MSLWNCDAEFKCFDHAMNVVGLLTVLHQIRLLLQARVLVHRLSVALHYMP
jgi:hypothetical protein